MPAGDDADREDREWAVSLEDLEEGDGDDESDGSVAGALVPDRKIQAGDIDPENALFVVLGVLSTCLVILTFVVALV